MAFDYNLEGAVGDAPVPPMGSTPPEGDPRPDRNAASRGTSRRGEFRLVHFESGRDHYLIAIFGTPDEVKPWMIEFGGHFRLWPAGYLGLTHALRGSG